MKRFRGKSAGSRLLYYSQLLIAISCGKNDSESNWPIELGIILWLGGRLASSILLPSHFASCDCADDSGTAGPAVVAIRGVRRVITMSRRGLSYKGVVYRRLNFSLSEEGEGENGRKKV